MLVIGLIDPIECRPNNIISSIINNENKTPTKQQQEKTVTKDTPLTPFERELKDVIAKKQQKQLQIFTLYCIGLLLIIGATTFVKLGGLKWLKELLSKE
ncbi:MAG: hypothetical protein FWC33_06060 [Candidatus Bathyarchaeota archaeon]|nr:hypothetical protein [Candidatus Termiticorpusculum sp.]